MKVKEPLFEYINPDSSHDVINGDSLDVLKRIKDRKFDLIITSPPYNVGKSYETKNSIEKYLESQEEIINEIVRTLSDKGNLCWQVGNYVDKGEVLPTKKMQCQMSSGVAYYEGEVYNVLRHGRNNPPVPLLILGIEQD